MQVNVDTNDNSGNGEVKLDKHKFMPKQLVIEIQIETNLRQFCNITTYYASILVLKSFWTMYASAVII